MKVTLGQPVDCLCHSRVPYVWIEARVPYVWIDARVPYVWIEARVPYVWIEARVPYVWIEARVPYVWIEARVPYVWIEARVQCTMCVHMCTVVTSRERGFPFVGNLGGISISAASQVHQRLLSH